MLAVVQHQQQAPAGQPVPHDVRRRPARLVGHAQRARHRRGHQVRVGQRRQLDQPDAVRVVAGHRPRRLQRQARLADAARPGQRQQPGLPPGAAATSASSRSRPTRLVSGSGQVAGSAGWRRGGRGAPPRDGGLQPGPLRRRQAQGVRQPAERVRVGDAARAALQVADGARAQAGPLGQRLLRQPGRDAQPPQRLAEGGGRVGGHRLTPWRATPTARSRPVTPPAYPTGASRSEAWGDCSGIAWGSRGPGAWAARPAGRIVDAGIGRCSGCWGRGG